MVDPEAVRRRLGEIDERIGRLRLIEALGADVFLSTPSMQAEAERHLQLAIQAAIDIAVHLIAEDSARTPEDYGSAFLLLADGDVIDESLAARLRAAAGLRNILVHAYLDVDPARVWEAIGSLEDLVRFAVAVESRLPP